MCFFNRRSNLQTGWIYNWNVSWSCPTAFQSINQSGGEVQSSNDSVWCLQAVGSEEVYKLLHCKELAIGRNIEGRNGFTDYLLCANSLPSGCIPCHNTCTSVYGDIMFMMVSLSNGKLDKGILKSEKQMMASK